MAEFIVNPRRAPRAPARCRAAVLHPRGRFEADTEDVGSMGCQVVAPKAVGRGDPVVLLVTCDRVDEPLEAKGRVAWVSAREPWRVGIAFDDGSLLAAARWFELLVAACPGLGGGRRVPDRIRTDAMVYLGPPPRFLLDFTRDEALLLRTIASGVRVDELMARFRDRWTAAQCALFSLLARQAVTLQRGQAVHPTSWRSVLTEIEASLAVESLGEPGPAAPARDSRGERERPAALSRPPAAPSATPPLAPPRPRPREAPPPPPAATWPSRPHDPTRVVDLWDDGPPLELATPTPAPAAGGGAGAGRRNGPQRRSAAAQASYELALAHVRAGRVDAAIELLRHAMSLAPGDPDIARQLGALASKDPPPGDG
jgi:hypothetical protein